MDPERDAVPSDSADFTSPETLPPGALSPAEPSTSSDAPGAELAPATDSSPEPSSGTRQSPANAARGRSTDKQPRPAAASHTRIGAAWVAVAVAVVVLVLLLIFILQNQDQVTVTLFQATTQMPLGVVLLLAACAGALLVIVLGVARILQLRWLARRDRRNHSAGGARARQGR